MHLSNWVRQFHRWLAILFTATVLANLIGMAFGGPPDWIVYAPLPAVFLLMFTGLYLFALPYAARRRNRRGRRAAR